MRTKVITNKITSDLLNKELRITEIFFSLQGETGTVGQPTVFIRLTGCPLRCKYCDTAYAFTGGKKFTIAAIVEEVAQYDANYITVTGGEPLAQPDCLALLKVLCGLGYTVGLETSGALDIAAVDPRVSKIVDLKTPASGELQRNLYANLQHVTSNDAVKFVICDREDYEWAKVAVIEHNLLAKCEVLFSPSYSQLAASTLADWIIADRLKVRFQLQLHKVLWGEAPGR